MGSHDIPGGSWQRRNNRCIFPRQTVEKTRFSHVGQPGQHHSEAFPQPLALSAPLKLYLDFLGQEAEHLAATRQRTFTHMRLLDEVDRRFKPPENLDQPSPPVRKLPACSSFRMPDGLPSLPFGSRLDKVGKAFDFEEIELAVAECPPR